MVQFFSRFPPRREGGSFGWCPTILKPQPKEACHLVTPEKENIATYRDVIFQAGFEGLVLIILRLTMEGCAPNFDVFLVLAVAKRLC